MKSLRWSDVWDIARELEDKYPEVSIYSLSFPTLHQYIIDLEGFIDDPESSNESVLEAIQAAWDEERS
ncbi:Fe-S cluster assembly protein IscX [Candidatus Hepatincolaceae symbiont of Richtersius coronifer]